MTTQDKLAEYARTLHSMIFSDDRIRVECEGTRCRDELADLGSSLLAALAEHDKEKIGREQAARFQSAMDGGDEE